MSVPINKIAVLTSGGDSPGMNAALRAVVRACTYYRVECVGVYRGYQGLIEGDFESLAARHVSNIINKGGTILKSARSSEFKTLEGRAKAYQNLKEKGVGALIVAGGIGVTENIHGKNVFIEDVVSNSVVILDTTNATSKTTGALIV